MNLAVRPACLSADREEMLGLLERNVSEFLMEAQFSWTHEGNPAGPGWSWLIYDRENGRIGAMTSLCPRPVYVDGRRLTCGQVGEFVVDRAYRSLGPAVMLQRATFEPVDSGALAFCYDCPPHDQGMSTFVRLGMHPSCELTRYAFLLNSNEVLEKRLGKRAWTRPLVSSANLLLWAKRTTHHRVSGVEIGLLEGRFDDEFDHLDRVVPSAGIVRASRSSGYLNWRFRERPGAEVRVLIAREGGELLAFLAFFVYGGRRALICDLFGRKLEEAGPALLSCAIEQCRRNDVACLEGYCTQNSALRALFESAGFRAREHAARIVAYARSGEFSGGILGSAAGWPVGQAELNA